MGGACAWIGGLVGESVGASQHVERSACSICVLV